MTDTYVCVDLETTGLNPKRDKIIEIGAVKVVQGKKEEIYSSFVNPGRKLEERIVELTGIRDEDLAQAPDISEVLPKVIDFLGEFPLLGHSILFDYSFLKKAAVDRKLDFEKKGIDTLKIARKYLASLENRSLDYLCEYYGIPHQAHRALEDAEATCTLYGKLAEQFYKEEENLFCPAPLIFSVKRDTPATPRQKEALYRLIKQHKIIPDMDVEKLTRSEASRFTDKIFSEYGR
ncbi:MAG: 3'-5' exonuclease [Lachnoclostridium sp.]|nr:3'-5' exonuclease [Lachnospira sp.]MCM1248907.1 3'-5' exonuclease [Lachnoclostridium sp.]MCM1535237.1 3'-5' exonuclease [Clostridium sp.]